MQQSSLSMKKPALLFTVIAFFFCYMEWGSGQSAFLYEAALQVFSQRYAAVPGGSGVGD